MMNIDEFKSLVEQKGSVFRDGGNWRGRCPAPNDDGRRGDLTFRSGDDGWIVLHCFGGCSARSVVEAMGLQWSDLFSENGHSPATRAPMRGTPPKHAYPTINEATEAIQRRLGGSFTAMWTYHNAEGIEVLYVVRLDDCEKAGNHKQYRPIHPVDGGFSEGDPSGKLPLYNLPAILANATDPVFVNEGEKATDASTSIGLLSTTSAHGSQSPAKTDWSPLAGRDVVILPDNDPAGMKYAETVAGILLRLNAKVRIVALPGLPDGGDLVDYVDDSEAEDVETIKGNIVALAEEAEPVKDIPQPAPAVTDDGKFQPNFICMADVEAKPIEWLWQDRVPSAMLSLLIGIEGLGKTYAALDATARVTTGRPWPDATGPTDAPAVGNVVFLTSEDHLAYTVRPRLHAVVPTRLARERFYQNFADLYRQRNVGPYYNLVQAGKMTVDNCKRGKRMLDAMANWQRYIEKDPILGANSR